LWIVKKCLKVISYNQSLTVFLKVGTITSLCGHWLLDYKRMNVSASVGWPPCIWIPCHTFLLSICDSEADNSWMNNTVFRSVTSCSLVDGNQNFGGTSCHRLRNIKWSEDGSSSISDAVSGINVHKQRPMTLSQSLLYVVINWISAFACFVIELECQARMVGLSIENWRTATLSLRRIILPCLAFLNMTKDENNTAFCNKWEERTMGKYLHCLIQLRRSLNMAQTDVTS
jgi:hypothetical protein